MKQPRLKPALILGSGFHRHTLGEQASGKVRCLFDWHELVTQTAQCMQVATPTEHQSPVLRWESMIIDAARDGYRDRRGHWRTAGPPVPHEQRGLGYLPVPATHHIELDAKATVSKLLQVSSQDYPNSRRAEIPLDPCWGCVISLNFDHAWQPGLRRSDLKKTQQVRSSDYGHSQIGREPGDSNRCRRMTAREERRLAASVAPVATARCSRPRLWYPNGSILQPESIRMGLRDYGAAPEAIRLAFNRLKAWEQRQGFSALPQSIAYGRATDALIKASEAGLDADLTEWFVDDSIEIDRPFPMTWVAEFLYRPLVFAGVGLSDQETGIWWLLAQRRRNLARVENPANGSVRILLNRAKGSGSQCDDRSAFWATQPLGVEPLYCDDWRAGWDTLMQMMRQANHKDSRS